MSTKSVSLLFLSLFAIALNAQTKKLDSLSFLIGHWQGKGWRINPQGIKENFSSKEWVESKLNGTVIQIEGFHQVGEQVVHHALGILSWDEKNQKFRFSSYLSDGRQGEYQATIEENKLIWGMELPNHIKLRFQIQLDEKGQWYEVGEISMNNGPWQKAFVIFLDRA